MSLRFKAIQERAQLIFQKAKELYGVDISSTRIDFDLRGRVGGWASAKRNPFTGEVSDLRIRLNRDMILGNDFDHMINDTLPHELAHIVCYERPELGRNHDNGWRRVCIALGGNGQRTHSMEVTYAQGGTFDYITTTGAKITVGGKMHKKIQMGWQYRIKARAGGGMLTSACQWSQRGVGMQVVAAPKVLAPPAPLPAVSVTRAADVKDSIQLTWAEKVRRLIRQHKTKGVELTQVIQLAIVELGMTKERARSCVKAHWDKV